jgi:hypothetical protein
MDLIDKVSYPNVRNILILPCKGTEKHMILQIIFLQDNLSK